MAHPRPRLDAGRLDRAFELAAASAAGAGGYAALAVGTSDGPIRTEAFDRDGRLDAPLRSPIASITKPVTAVAVLQLVERGDLVLDQPLAHWLPDFRPGQRDRGESDRGQLDEPITAWHLLSHTSGLPDLGLEWYVATGRTPVDVVRELSAARPEFAPGSAFRYTTDTFQLLAAVIERCSGLAYPAWLDERLFGPLGMSGTSFDPDGLGASVDSAGAFGLSGQSQADIRAAFRTLAIPGGGLWSTPDDVLRFGLAMLGGGSLDGVRVLGRPFVDLMRRHHTANVREVGTGRAPNYGLGWGLPGLGRGTPASPESFGHAGATGSILLVDPAFDLVVVHLRNDWGATMLATDQVVQAVYGALS